MTTAETIYELVKTLPEDRAYMVLKFAEFLSQETSSFTPTEAVALMVDELDWEPGFFERTAGCLEDEPLIRHPQPPYDVRETLV